MSSWYIELPRKSFVLVDDNKLRSYGLSFKPPTLSSVEKLVIGGRPEVGRVAIQMRISDSMTCNLVRGSDLGSRSISKYGF